MNEKYFLLHYQNFESRYTLTYMDLIFMKKKDFELKL